jgi:predicted membrane-bound dolichyl-phosphate-mannose-protein mannosyltransferase
MLAALAVLIKPQGLMLVPVFGFWTLLESPPRAYLPSIAGAFGTFAVGVAPFQLGRPWDWIFSLYGATAAHYAETSVNAFNLLALLGGLRQPDSATVLGVSYFTVGMLLLVPLYAYAGYLLWRRRDAHTLYFAAFIAIFGFFILAPRMHERYLYAALVFGAPLAAQCATMLALYAALTVACLVNLASVLDVLNTGGFFAPRDPLAMAASAVNVSLFAAALWYGWTRLDKAPARAAPDVLRFLSDRLFAAPPPAAADTAESPSPAWLRADTMVIIALTAAAIATRFWNLSHPGEIVFDEVHFVGQARHYLRAEPFLDPHPPLAKLVIAAGIWLFGDGPWGWRVGIAAVGTALVPITYLLARRMMRSRTAGALAAAFVLADGMFLVDSRIAVIDIVYVTLAALSYLLLFRFVDSRDDPSRRRALLGLGAALGLCVAAKLYVPAFTFLLVMGFLGYVLTRDHRRPTRRDVAAFALTGSVAALAYLAVFLPHYAHGWWGGIEDLFNYYRDVIWYQESVAAATHPYASPWWSWPLMLRPIAYWQEFPKEGAVAIVWAGGNPVLWWGALTAITITAVQALERPTLARSFLVIAYLGYLAIWIWVGRTLFLYHYLPAVYLGYVALAAVLTQAWQGRAEPWEHLALLLTLAPALVLSLGVVAGFGIFLLILIAYAWQLATSPRAGRLVTALFVAAAAIAFVYFLPIWLGLPIDRASFYERMWLKGPGIRNWI